MIPNGRLEHDPERGKPVFGQTMLNRKNKTEFDAGSDFGDRGKARRLKFFVVKNATPSRAVQARNTVPPPHHHPHCSMNNEDDVAQGGNGVTSLHKPMVKQPNRSKRFQIFEKGFLIGVRQACPELVAATAIA